MPDTPLGERLRLRFVTRAEMPLLRERYEYEPGGFNDFGMPRSASRSTTSTDPAETDNDPRTELRDERHGLLFVERLEDGRALGTISYHRVQNGPNAESGAWMIGIELVPESRGRGYGSEAQRLLADWLLETTELNRVEAQTDIDNVAEARSLDKAGFTREGVLRGAQFRAGRYHDLVVYSRLRSDPR